MSVTLCSLLFAILGEANTLLYDKELEASLQILCSVLRCIPHTFADVACVLD
jgi:hypothetical protein